MDGDLQFQILKKNMILLKKVKKASVSVFLTGSVAQLIYR